MTAPPTSGPPTTARPASAVKIPSALPRFSGGKALVSSATASGITSADPAPCTARAAISVPVSGASAHAAEASEKTDNPTANMRRRPPVAERGAGDQQDREAEAVGVRRPFECGERRVQAVTDRVERGGNHELVRATILRAAVDVIARTHFSCSGQQSVRVELVPVLTRLNLGLNGPGGRGLQAAEDPAPYGKDGPPPTGEARPQAE